MFAVDMDQVLSEQPPDTWDSFPLFQVLNDYLRTDGESWKTLKSGSILLFHFLYLLETSKSQMNNQ